MKDAALIVFVKNKEKGKVKTRLAATVGDEKALQIYEALLDHTRIVSQKVNADRLLFYSSFIEDDSWNSEYFQKFIQQGNELGDKMNNAFNQALVDHQKVVIIGSDCASLTTEIIEEAFRQLDQHSYVIGPALDGGYYLLGMKIESPFLFEDIPWSTIDVLPKTTHRIEATGESYHLLPLLSDIDTEEDWNKYGQSIQKIIPLSLGVLGMLS